MRRGTYSKRSHIREGRDYHTMHKKYRLKRDVSQYRRLIEARDCNVCKENKADIRYTFYSKHPSNNKACYLEYVCSLKCGIEQIGRIYDVYERQYSGLWRNGINGHL